MTKEEIIKAINDRKGAVCMGSVRSSGFQLDQWVLGDNKYLLSSLWGCPKDRRYPIDKTRVELLTIIE